MNKLLVIILAICLAQAHAYVKRDVEPTKNKLSLESIKKQIQDISKIISSKLSDTLNADQIKNNFNKVFDNLGNALHLERKVENPTLEATTHEEVFKLMHTL
ncbi:unnamed protein product [Parnassius apollo]|uniref:(apollo) hypothetical protein n=1 Tax=Parnassius apollo TaxID=110799 RepID=A0A8S3Y230_PARAO|nr:unnamed protein product [Parnassius apollo]